MVQRMRQALPSPISRVVTLAHFHRKFPHIEIGSITPMPHE
jgi:hypothetical protein